MRRRLAVLAASLSLVLTGCSGGEDPLAWAEKVCGSIEPEMKKVSAVPEIDPSNPQQAKQAMSTYLGDLAGAVGNMVRAMDDAGEPDVDGGQEAVDKATAALNKAKASLEKAKTTLDGADTSDPAQFQAAFAQVGQDMQSIEMDDPTAEFERVPELDKAFKQAESCKRIERAGS